MNGETTLPRFGPQHPAFAMTALALVLVAPVHAARAQSNFSAFAPKLADPRNPQKFGTQEAVTPNTILPPAATGETGFNAGTPRKKRIKPRSGDPKLPATRPLALPGAPQAAAGMGSPPQIRERAGYAEAYRPPDAPLRRPRPPITDPYESLGLRVGTFIVKPAIEINRGYDTNPGRNVSGRPGSGYTELLPTLNAKSDWKLHEASLDLRGSYSQSDSIPSLNRPMLDVKARGRYDISRDTDVNGEGRFLLSSDYPGSPNVQAGFARLPIFTTTGGTLGVTQRFNHLELSAKGSVDRTEFQPTPLVDGSQSDNTDRNYQQYAAAARVAYEIYPGVKPFAEMSGDVRTHDLKIDRDGYQRDSQSLTPRVGTTFDIARRLTGELSAGYTNRVFDDPGLTPIRGVVADASLIWSPTGLTTVTLTASSRANETVVSGVSGIFSRDIGVQVDHAFRRWLIWTTRAGYGHDTYVGEPCSCNGYLERADDRVSLGTALTYKFTREVSIKGEYRYDQRRSNAAGSDFDAHAFIVGLKLQR